MTAGTGERHTPDLREIFCGDDPEMPGVIWPISWLRSMIDECKRHAAGEDEIEDIDAYYEMIGAPPAGRTIRTVSLIEIKHAARLFRAEETDD